MEHALRNIILDAGHGGLVDGVYQTAGKKYTFTIEANPGLARDFVVYEGVINRMILLHTARTLLALKAGTAHAGRIAIIDGSTGQEFTPAVVDAWIQRPGQFRPQDTRLSKRVAIANAHDKDTTLLLSLHCDAFGNALVGPSQTPTGLTAYTSPGETRSDTFASLIYSAAKHAQKTLAHRGRFPSKIRTDYSDGDPDKESPFYLLTRTDCASVLVEHGFFTNLAEARMLSRRSTAAAFGIMYGQALLPYFPR